jgi:hypothetical protein
MPPKPIIKLAYTGKRQESYESLRASRGAISSETYREGIAELNRRQAVANRLRERAANIAAILEAQREARAFAASEAAAAARRVRAAEAARLKRAAVFAAFRVPVDAGTESDEVYAISGPAEGDFQIFAEVGGRIVRKMTFHFPAGMSRGNRHKKLRAFYLWKHGSESDTIFEAQEDETPLPLGTRIRIGLRRLSVPLAPASLAGAQAFADGTLHCVAEPLARIWDGFAAAATAHGSQAATIATHKKRARQCRAYGMEYPEGIPEGAPMERMAEISRRRIIIQDLLSGTYATYGAKYSNIQRFTNTRENHLDVGHIVLDGEATIIPQEEMVAIVADHNRKGDHYMFDGMDGAETCLRSGRGVWRIENPLNDVMRAHDKANGFINAEGRSLVGLDSIKYPEANDWLHASMIVHAVPVRLSEAEPTGHIDLKYAYTQHPLVPEQYKLGFPVRIHQWRRLKPGYGRDFVAAHFGLYKVRVLHNEDAILQKLGLVATHILPSPEVLYFMDRGVEFEVLSGMFCASGDITYDASMFEDYHSDTGMPYLEGDVGPKVKAYSKWAGCQSYDSDKRQYHFKGTEKWANHLAAEFGADNVSFYNGKITLTRRKEHNRTRHHLLAFITAYTRINVLEAMKGLNVVGVVLDGIYYADSLETMPAGFREKEAKKLKTAPESKWYDDCVSISDDFMPLLEDERLLRNCVLAGAGGTGKTHEMLTDAGFHDIMYVVPQHDLGIAKKDMAPYSTWSRAAGIPFGKVPTRTLVERGYSPSVMVFDEATMIHAEYVEKAISLYPLALIFIIADIERRADGSIMAFQCRNGDNKGFFPLWNPPASWGWKVYTKDWRSKDEEIKAFKLQLRDWMRAGYTDGGKRDAFKIRTALMASGRPLVPLATAVASFAEGDTWIAGTHTTSNELLRLGVCVGWIGTGDDAGKKSTVEVAGWIKRGSYTTHSYQGQTVETGRLFVSIYDGFEHAMLYTAISRAIRMDQIVLVTR